MSSYNGGNWAQSSTESVSMIELCVQGRSNEELSGSSCSGSGSFEARDGNLYCFFSTERCPVIRKRGKHVEVASNIQPNFFGLNVRRNGPQPSICVRSLSPITTPMQCDHCRRIWYGMVCNSETHRIVPQGKILCVNCWSDFDNHL